VRFGASDERAHRPDAEGWWEAWQLDVAASNGVGVAVMLACAPGLGVAWSWTHVLVPNRSGPIVVRDHEVPLPRVGLEVRADGLWVEQVCETPFEHWTYGLEAFGVALDDPAESLRGEIGERIPVGFDLEWEVDDAAGEVRELETASHGYEQFGAVHGEVLLARSRVEVDAVGRRVHRWGVPSWDRSVSSWWTHGPDATFTPGAGAPPPSEELGRFLVPVSITGARGVVTRTLCRFDCGNGWSSRYEPV
jgi:hypothetical protein